MTRILWHFGRKVGRIASLVGLGALTFFVGNPALGDSLQFSVTPASGHVSGIAGDTVGWGYSITNQSTSDWLVTTDLVSDAFLHGTPSLLFDFPDIGPGETMTEAFNPIAGTGLYELIWDASAPSGFINSGNFVLSSQWWDGNPASGGTFIADAPDAIVSYSASVSSSAIPEPTSLGLLGLGVSMVLIACVARLRKHKQRRFAG
ncbi:MAG: PEP-CTERM sorting domain-containing protein [Bryobacteraceae bacterium]